MPCMTSMVCVAGVQPDEAGSWQEAGPRETVIVCVPTGSLTVIGVTLPVSTLSTNTFAPDGNDVTFKAPPSARRFAGRPSRPSAMVTTVVIKNFLIPRILSPPKAEAGSLRLFKDYLRPPVESLRRPLREKSRGRNLTIS